MQAIINFCEKQNTCQNQIFHFLNIGPATDSLMYVTH